MEQTRLTDGWDGDNIIKAKSEGTLEFLAENCVACDFIKYGGWLGRLGKRKVSIKWEESSIQFWLGYIFKYLIRHQNGNVRCINLVLEEREELKTNFGIIIQ